MDNNKDPKCAPQLLDLSDCVLLTLLSCLDATSLYNLSRTCQRLRTIVADGSLWRSIDARQSPNTKEKVKYCCEQISNSTSRILFRGEDSSKYILPDDFFTTVVSFNYVKVLVLENQSIQGTQFNITCFPKSLEELSLKKTRVSKPEEFFRLSESSMRSLRVLILDECDWLVSSCLMAISKYKSLEILSLYKCMNLENSIPYLSLSAQYGFKKLRILDTRLSGNSLLRSFYNSTSLIGIYLQNRDLSYKIDCLKGKLTALENGNRSEHVVLDDLEIDNQPTNHMNGSTDEPFQLDDLGLIDYMHTFSDHSVVEYPKSELYVDPFGECTCNYDSNEKELRNDDSSGDDDDTNKDDLMKKMRRKIHKMRKLLRFRGNHHYSQTSDNRMNSSQQTFDSSPPPAKRIKLDFPSTSGQSNINNGDDDGARKYARNYDIVVVEPILNRAPTPHPEYVLDDDDDDDDYAAPPIYIRENVCFGPGAPQIIRLARFEANYKVPIKRLCLRGYKQITNNALRYLKKIDLNILDITYTSITVDAINDYLIEHPSCRVIHESFCKCPLKSGM